MLKTAQPTEAELATYNAASEILRNKVAELRQELPGISFGYLGNFERWGDDRSFYVFLPTVDRPGDSGDQVALGTYSRLPQAVEQWEHIAAAARKRYHNGSRRA